MKDKKEIYGKICKVCTSPTCCRDGVEVDLEEAKRISRLKVKIRKPWFQYLHRAPDLPSGWGLETIVRNGRCVFQHRNGKCRIYRYRPYYCREFPYEGNEFSEEAEYLCRRTHNYYHKVIKSRKSRR